MKNGDKLIPRISLNFSKLATMISTRNSKNSFKPNITGVPKYMFFIYYDVIINVFDVFKSV